MYKLIPARTLYDATMVYDEEEFWKDIQAELCELANAHQQYAVLTLLANIMIDMNVEATLKAAGYDVDIMEYDPESDTYVLHIFWDKIAIEKKGTRRMLHIDHGEEIEDYDEEW